jgi:hypothetical protein
MSCPYKKQGGAGGVQSLPYNKSIAIVNKIVL